MSPYDVSYQSLLLAESYIQLSRSLAARMSRARAWLVDKLNNR